MSRRVYSNGVLIEEWDDATLTYRAFTNGEVTTERTYTAGEVADIVGAGAVVVNERQFVVLDDDGSEIFRIGDMQHGDRGLQMTRENGQPAFTMRKPFSNSANQTVLIQDAVGNDMLSEEALGFGLAKPFFPIPMIPVRSTSGALNAGPWGPEVPVTSGTFVTTHQAWLIRLNRWAQFRVRVSASDLTTAGEVQVIDVATGLPLAGFFAAAWLGTRPTGSTGYTELIAGAAGESVGLPGNPHERISVAIQVRRTAGAGTLNVAVPEAHGWGA